MQRGLHVVRYASSGVGRDFPIATVVPADGFESLIQIISSPGTREGWLDRPGSAVVLRVQGAAKVEIGLRRSSPTGSLDASFQVDALTNESSPSPRPGETPAAAIAESRGSELATAAAPGIASESPKFAILGHVAMRGDVTTVEDEWMAGPDSPAPIEGLCVKSPNRELLSVEMQVLVVGAQQWSVWVGDNVYAGTRGRGLPLAGVRLRLVGADSASTELTAEALFLGSMVQKKSGRQIEFSSSTGSEPLVGFKLAARRAESASGGRIGESPWQERGSRVRIYKASGE